ncbi:unnamed protein product [Trypanosoma congolense IL3000]|uniref:WGS project CAEQ00000000 data, annotated contig 1920 n=1 Tax=Trypanosoma congolense (strain IL3000) TaxID=1068625 RepID=F9WA16_TRYCI|nr:unnamed protein product [Trypanosoma congolense IL3000]
MSRVPTTIRASLLSALIVLLRCGAAAGEEANSRCEAESTPTSGGTLKLALDESIFAPLATYTREFIKNWDGGISIPSVKTNSFQMEASMFQNIVVGSMSIEFKAPNKLHVSVGDVSVILADTPTVFGKQMSCTDGIAWGGFSNSSAWASLNVTRGPDGTFNVTPDSMEVVVRNLYISIDSDMCFWGAISFFMGITLYIGEVTELVENSISSELRLFLGEFVTDWINSLPIVLMESPNITDGRAELSLFILPNTNASRKVPRDSAITLAQPLPQRALSVVSSFAAANSVMQLLGNWGLLNVSVPFPAMYNSSLIEPIYPELHRLCPVCPLEISCEVTSDVQVGLSDDGAFVLKMQGSKASLNLVAEDNTTIDVLSMLANTTATVARLSIRGNTLYIRLSTIAPVLTVETSRIGNVNSTKYSSDIAWLANELGLPLINARRSGFKLPFEAPGLLLDVTEGLIVAGMSVSSFTPLLMKFL